MSILLLKLAAEHAPAFVIMALLICLLACWLLAVLLRQAEHAARPSRRWWVASTAAVAGLGVWTTHFMAMLGYRPDAPVAFDALTTAASAIIAVVAVGIPLAASAVAVPRLAKIALGALAGLGIGAMHLTGMAAIEGCVQTYSLGASVLACAAGAVCLALARGLAAARRSHRLTCVLATLGVCGTHFTAISGTTIAALGPSGGMPNEHAMLSAFTAAGAAVLFLGALLSIVAARRFEAQGEAHSAILATALHNMSNGLIFMDDDGRLKLFNRRFIELCRLQPDALWIGMPLEMLLDALGKANDLTDERRRVVRASFLKWLRFTDTGKTEYTTTEGRILEVESQRVQGGGAVLTFDDVTHDRQVRSQISHMAFHDPLTGLANRRSLQVQMEGGFATRLSRALVLVDLDRFKAVNDTFGHSVGDQLLVQVADRLRQIAGPKGFVARLGGDEMAVLVDGDLDPSMAERIVEAVGKPFAIDGAVLSVGCSIGTCGSDDAADAEELMQRADIALYESKRLGRGRTTSYRPGLLEAVLERHQLESDLRVAIETRQFHLAYQPVLAMAQERIVGYEALIRWDHPTRGPVPPAAFIPAAEESGQIVAIGQWVLEEACRQAAEWPEDRHVAVNVSPVQFRSPLLLSHVTTALARSGLAASRLEIELTETAIVEDGREIADTLDALRRLGITVAMDDFGTGYSSLAHLRDFPLDRIKIDRSFVASAESDRHSMAVLKAVTQMGHDLGIPTLAEGVETDSQMQLLRSIGCDAVQGYLIGRPERMDPVGNTAQDRRAA